MKPIHSTADRTTPSRTYAYVDGDYRLELTGADSCREVAAIRHIRVWNDMVVFAKPVIELRSKVDWLAKLDTHLLIHVAQRLRERHALDMEKHPMPMHTRKLLEFIVSVLRFRAADPRFKDAFIELEFNPNSTQLNEELNYDNSSLFYN